jgi:aminopeptidase N
MLSAASEALTYFNRRFGAYEGDGEYELIAAPGMGGGMEYPGITLNDTNSPRSFLREVVIHETGHQWFYSMVGNNQHDDPWLDESFTSYITAEYLRAPAIDVATRLAPAIHGRRDRAPGSGRPLGPSNLPVRVSSPMSVLNGRGYVNMIYGEGARVLERLRRELGDEIFVRGMREHVATAKHGIASTAKFIEIMSNAAGRDLTGWFANNKVLATEPEAGKQHDPNRLV